MKMQYKTAVLFFVIGLIADDSLSQSRRIFWSTLEDSRPLSITNPEFRLQPTWRGGEDGEAMNFFYDVGNVYRLDLYGKQIIGSSDNDGVRVTPLEEGDTIGPSSENWQIGGVCRRDDCSRVPIISSANYTVWYGKTAYVGTHVFAGGRNYYGWVRITVSADGRTLKLNEYAFRLEPGMPIIAGERSDAIPSKAITQNSLTTCFSITNEGNIGYTLYGTLSDATTCPPTTGGEDGVGLFYKGRDMLFEGSFLLGFDEENVLSTARGDDAYLIQDRDFVQKPNSNFHVKEGENFQYGRAEFVDTEARNPVGISVVQESFSYNTSRESDFIFLRYTITNESEKNIENMFAGLWMDWDLGEGYDGDNHDFNDVRNFGFVTPGTPAYPLAGVRVLDSKFPKVNTYAFDVEEDLGSEDPNTSMRGTKRKWDALSGSLQRVYLFSADIVQLIGAGPISIAPGGAETVSFALIMGDDRLDLLDNADHAVATYNEDIWVVATEDVNPVPEWITIGEIFPHPVTHQATLTYKLTRSARVEVDVYDLLGRHVVQLLDATKRSGDYTLSWNLENFNLPSGVYSLGWTIVGQEDKYRDSRFMIVQ